MTKHRYWYEILPTLAPTETLAYLAGILDGEGYTGVGQIQRGRDQQPNRTGRSYRLNVAVGMQNRGALELFAQTFFSSTVRTADKSFRISWTSYKATAVLESLLPYLRVKQMQARVAIAFQKQMKNPRRTKWTEDDLERNRLFSLCVSELNRRDSRIYGGEIVRELKEIVSPLGVYVP